MMNFDAWTLFLDFSVIAILLLLAKIARVKIKLFQSLFIPAALIAGIIGLVLGPNGVNILPLSKSIGVYPSILVVLIFASVPLGKERRSFKDIGEGIGNMWAYSELLFLGQHALFIILGLFLFVPLFQVPLGFGFMLPTGFVGGHGTAAAVGATFKTYGWDEALSLGMTSATIGIIAGLIGGVILINYGTKKGYTRSIKSFSELPQELRTGLIEPQKTSSMGRETVSPISIDPLMFHLALILMAALAGYYVTKGVALLNPKLGLPMFAVAMICGSLLQFFLRKTGADKYVDGKITTRIGSTFTDLLVVFGVASINIPLVIKYALPLTILFILGIAYVVFMFLFVAPRMYKDYWFEKGAFAFGWSTGVASIGITLLRIVDPEFKSNTLDDFAISYIPMSFVEMAIVTLAPIAIATGFAYQYAAVVTAGVLVTLVIAWKMKWFYKHGSTRDKLNRAVISK